MICNSIRLPNFEGLSNATHLVSQNATDLLSGESSVGHNNNKWTGAYPFTDRISRKF